MRLLRRGVIAGLLPAMVASGFGGWAGAAPAWRYSRPRIELPFMKAPPIQGVVKPAQWAGADEMTGLSAGAMLAPWTAHFWVGGNAQDLLVAVVTQTPPGGKLLARVNPMPAGMNAHIITVDDDVEILVAPLDKNGQGRGTVYQLIVNAKGAIWQNAFRSRGAGAKAWHGHWKIANKVVGNRWNLQVAIPWKDFGIERIAGHSVGIRIVRDWMQRGPHLPWQTQWAPLGGTYTSVPTMPVVTFHSKAPVVQVRDLQNRPGGPVHIKLSIFNPGAGLLRVRSMVQVTPKEDPPVRQTQKITLAARQKKIIDIPAVATAHELLYTRILVESAHGKAIYYKRNFAWKINRPRQLWTLNAHASRRVDTAFMYYPSIQAMQVRVNLSDLADRAKVRAVDLQVRDVKTGRVVAAAVMPPVHNFVTRLREWKMPPLNGKYDLVVRLAGIGGKPQLLPFVRYHFKWQHNQLGRGGLIVHPFKGLAVHGRRVEMVLRQCTMNGLGLWGQVKALGQNLLSGPMRIVVRAGGKRFVGHGQEHFARISATQVIAVAHWAAGPLKGTSRSVWHYDGMMKTTLRLQPTAEKLDSVVLVIPMVNKQMPLMTACTDGLRFNYAGKTPTGLGEIWNGSEAPRNSIIGSFVPYIWTGGPERGVAVFGDNDAGWVDYQAQTPCQELVRKADGTLELRLNLVAEAARLKTAHKIVLGFQATPIKPMPKDWRRWSFNDDLPGCYHVCYVGACYYWGALTAFGDVYPRGHDWSIYKQFARTRRTGKIPYAFIQRWLAGYRAPTPSDARQYGPSVRDLFSGLADHPQAVIVYTNPAAMRVDTRAGRTYLNEWDRHVYPTRRYVHGEYFDFTVNPCRSFRDFALWYYHKMLTTFDSGIYWDNVFLKSDFNTVLTNAYRLPDGYVQPATTLWSTRALIRRTAEMDAQLGLPDRNMCHMTNTAIAPILAFARVDLDWEEHISERPFQDRFSRAFILTESIGRQFGNVPVVLSDMHGNNAKKIAWALRTETGVVLTFELKKWPSWTKAGTYRNNFARLIRFGYGTRRVKVWNYWRHGYPLRVTGDKTSSLVVAKRNGDEAVVVVCDWGHGGTIRVKLNRKELHWSGRVTAINMETKRPVGEAPLRGNEIEFHLKKFDFIMLLVKAGKPARR